MGSIPIRGALWTAVIICFASSYVVSYGDAEVTVTVSNGTRHFLHVVIDNQPFIYVAPGGSAQTETGRLTAFVEVRYSPGQGISGLAEKELSSIVTSSSTSRDANTCSNDGSGTCENDYSTSVSSVYSRSPMSWRVTPADFRADTASTAD